MRPKDKHPGIKSTTKKQSKGMQAPHEPAHDKKARPGQVAGLIDYDFYLDPASLAFFPRLAC
jgi:hypothetical protein